MFISVSNQEVTKSNCTEQAGSNIWLVSECLVSEMDASSHSALKWRSVSPKSCSENTRVTILTFCCLKLPTLPCSPSETVSTLRSCPQGHRGARHANKILFASPVSGAFDRSLQLPESQDCKFLSQPITSLLTLAPIIFSDT